MIKILLSLKTLLIICSCTTYNKRDLKVWAADSFSGSIRRTQADEEISCLDIKFDEYICIHKNHLDTLLNRCEE